MSDKTIYAQTGTIGNQFGSLTTGWATLPSGTFGSSVVETFGTFSASTNIWTAPSSGLPDGVLVLMNLESEDSSNGRVSFGTRVGNVSGTGNLCASQAWGYSRDASEDRAFVQNWAVINNPSASSTWVIEGRRGTDAPGTGDEFVNGNIMFIPLYYNAIGLYSSASTQALGGTTQTRITGFSSIVESDTASIELGATTANVVDIKNNGSRYLILAAGQHSNNASARTQRVLNIRADSTNRAEGVMYSRQSSASPNGTTLFDLIEGGASAQGIDLTGYRGRGVGARQGGADVDGTMATSGLDWKLAIIELNSAAEVIRTHSTSQQECALTGPVDLNLADVVDFNDAAAYTKASASVINAEAAHDAICLASINCPRNTNSIGSGSRWTARAHWTVGGTEQARTRHGDYNRGNQGTTDTMGWSGHPAGLLTLALNDDLGASVQELAGSEGGNGDIETEPFASNEGLVFIAINADSLQAAGDVTRAPGKGTVTLSGKVPTVQLDTFESPGKGTITLSGKVPSVQLDTFESPGKGTITLGGKIPLVVEACFRSPDKGTLTLTGRVPSVEVVHFPQPSKGTITLNGKIPSVAITVARPVPKGTLTLTGRVPSVEIEHFPSPGKGTITLDGKVPSVEETHFKTPGKGTLTLTGQVPSVEIEHFPQPAKGALTLTGHQPVVLAGDFVAKQPPKGTLTLSGKAPSVEVAHFPQPSKGTVTLAGKAPSLTFTLNIAVPKGTATLSGKVPVVDITQRRVPGKGTITLSGKVPTVSILQIRSPSKGTLTFSGSVPSVTITQIRSPGKGTLTLTGYAPTLIGDDIIIGVPKGLITFVGHQPRRGRGIRLIGYPPTVIRTENHEIAIPKGTLSLVGYQPILGRQRSPAKGTITLVGKAPTVEINIVRRPAKGTITLVGYAPSIATTIAVPKGTLSLDGKVPTVVTGFVELLPKGSITLSGKAPSVEITHIREPGKGILTLVGQVPTIAWTTQPGTGTLTLSGKAPIARLDTFVTPGVGALTLTGLAPSIEITHVRRPDTGTLSLVGYAPNAFRGEKFFMPKGSITLVGHAPRITIRQNVQEIVTTIELSCWDIDIVMTTYSVDIAVTTYTVDIGVSCYDITIDVSDYDTDITTI